jgi:hypothetical protein
MLTDMAFFTAQGLSCPSRAPRQDQDQTCNPSKDRDGVQQRRQTEGIRQLLGDIGWTCARRANSTPEAEEPFGTFVENALTKARHAARLTGLPALADDSGVCVNAWAARPACIRRAMPASPSRMPTTTPS